MNRVERKKIAFVISGLGTGGAEFMLWKLTSRLDRKSFEPVVFSLTNLNHLEGRFREIEIPVLGMGMRRGVPDPRGFFRLTRRLREFRPDLVQTWMYHADLVGGLAARTAGLAPVVWNIRHSDLNLQIDKRSTILTARACARLSRWLPHTIVCCAEAAKTSHARHGYTTEKMIVIPNGFDLADFHPDAGAGARVRRELGIPPAATVIGMVARFHPQKDHRRFIQAAGNCAARNSSLRFVLCGDGITQDNRELATWIGETGFADRFFLLGRRTDMPAVTAAFDIACSASSNGEGFSNVLGEAMACGVPCVATEVGDAAQILGNTGRIVPPADPAALAEGILELAFLGPAQRARLGAKARQRVVEKFALANVIARYEDLYRGILNTPVGRIASAEG